VPENIWTWVDGVAANALPLPDRGLDYGDGLFETVRLVAGKPIFFDLHLKRLAEGMSRLGFPPTCPDINSQINSIVCATPCPAAASMRITVTRGDAPRGYAIPGVVVPRVIVTIKELEGSDYQVMGLPTHLSLAKMRWGMQPALAGIKHLNRLEQVLAASERQKTGADEVLVLDQNAQVISVSSGNIFIVSDGQLLTPPLTQCGVRGTRRTLVLETLAPALGLPAREAPISLSLFKRANEVFYCNALVGFRPVASFEGCTWHNADVCTALHRHYCERVN